MMAFSGVTSVRFTAAPGGGGERRRRRGQRGRTGGGSRTSHCDGAKATGLGFSSSPRQGSSAQINIIKQSLCFLVCCPVAVFSHWEPLINTAGGLAIKSSLKISFQIAEKHFNSLYDEFLLCCLTSVLSPGLSEPLVTSQAWRRITRGGDECVIVIAIIKW